MEQLLATKFFIPSSRLGVVSRPRLIKQLDQGLHCKLTLVSAPAGYGKTTLVSEWVKPLSLDDQLKVRISWLSLDENDNDSSRFLTYFISALNKGKEGEEAIGEDALGMLQSPQPPPAEAVLTTLINQIAAIPDNIIHIFDDYHLVDNQTVHDALDFLLEHMPPQMHVVLVTREDPLLPLSRLRARCQLTELRAADLRFSSSEAAEFLNQVMGLSLSADDVTALENRTEGWIAGLQLAALSLRGQADQSNLVRSFTGSNRYVLDYLIEEVLQHQPESLQSFLLQTSILSRLTGPLCDALTGQHGSQETLEILESANLFLIPMDNERQWYRYHHLFANLLRQRLDQTLPEQLPILHRKASNWYEQNGDIDEAIVHALHAGDFDHAADLIEKHIESIWGTGRHSTIQRWVAKLPVELVFSKPNLCIFHAWYLFVNGQRDAAEQALQAADQIITTEANPASKVDNGDLTKSENTKLQGRIAAIQAFIANYQGDIPNMVARANKGLEYLPPADSTWRCLCFWVLGDAYLFKGEMIEAYQARLDAIRVSEVTGHFYLILVSNLRLAETLRHQGKLKQAIELCKQQMQFVEESGISQTVAAGWLLALWGDLLAEKNDLDEALKKAQKGVELGGRGSRDVSFFAWSNLFLVRVLFSRGDLTGAEQLIHNVQNVFRERDMPILAPIQLFSWQARIWLEQNELDKAVQWAEENKIIPDGELSFFRESEYVILARILIAQGRLDEAVMLLQRLLEEAEAGGRKLRVIEILNLQTLAFQTADKTNLAINTLERSLTMAEPEGFIRAFVDEGPKMIPLLVEAHHRGIALEYIERLLSTFPNFEPKKSVSTHTQVPASELVEPLSERELEVLQLVAEGLTNPEIAARLYVSLNTIKVHTRNIYGKLGVNNRIQAVAKGRDLGILTFN